MEKRIIKDCENYINELEMMKSVQIERLKEIKAYCRYNLKRKKSSNGTWHYSAINKDSEKQKYLGEASVPEVEKIKECRYLNASIDAIENNLRVVRRAYNSLRTTDYDSINALLPTTYQNPHISQARSKDMTAKEWKERAEALKSRYDAHRPEELIIKTNDGSMVRSKSEAMIYNYLLSVGVSFVYELPLKLRTGVVRPDFVLLSEQDYKTEIIIEHQGLIGDDYYRKRFVEKVYKYIQDGYVQGINIFFTFDSINGGFDKTPIEDLVRNRIKN